jgi:hypothetical protein
MVLALEDDARRILTATYDGNTRAWSAASPTHTTTAYGNPAYNRPFDVVWDPASGADNVLLVFSDDTGIYTALSTNGGALFNSPTLLDAAGRAWWVQANRETNTNDVRVAYQDQNDDLHVWRWNGAMWTQETAGLPISTNLETGTNHAVEPFALVQYPSAGISVAGTTAVRLASFDALPGDGSVTLEWRTGSELDNLGFHVWRGPSAEGPWTRLTGSLVPGLGSSPLGQAYSWLDAGLRNGERYYYRLEDVDTASVSTFHGPVSAVPEAAAGGGGDGDPAAPGEESGEGEGGGGSGGEETARSCPRWLLVEAGASGEAVCERHGDPESVSVEVTSSDATGATVELRTGGFWTVAEAGGTVRVSVPGLEVPLGPGALALPVRRALVPAVSGRGVELVSVEGLEERRFARLRPSAAGRPEMVVSSDGTVRASRRAQAAPVLSRGVWPRELASLSGTVFQGEAKSAVVQIAPVRFDASRGELVLSGRVVVRLSYSGAVEGETGSGRSVPGWSATGSGRRLPRKGDAVAEVVARLYTRVRGLHAVRFEDVLGRSSRAVSVSGLRLQRRGEAVALHVEPPGGVFGPGSTLYFHADETARSDAFSGEVAYELVSSREGRTMGVVSGAPAGAPLGVGVAWGLRRSRRTGSTSRGCSRRGTCGCGRRCGGACARVPVHLRGVEAGSSLVGEVTVELQGGSDASGVVDHHVEGERERGAGGGGGVRREAPHVLR